MDDSYPELKNQLLRRLNDLRMIAAPQAARVTSKEPDQEAEQRWAIVERIEKIEKQLQSLPTENTPITKLLVLAINAQIDAIAKNIGATEQKDNPAANPVAQRSTVELIRYEKAQAKARLQSVCADAGSAKKPNLSVTFSPSLAMLERIRAHQNISFDLWVKGNSSGGPRSQCVAATLDQISGNVGAYA